MKNAVKMCEQCIAKRANGEQCTRKRKEENEYCGTHIKGIPHGVIEKEKGEKELLKKVEVWAQDIRGIMYYIDKEGNVYQTEDVHANKMNPKKIASYVKVGEKYSIPELGL